VSRIASIDVFVVVTGSCRPFLPSARQRHVYELPKDAESSCELLCCTWYFMWHTAALAGCGLLLHRYLDVPWSVCLSVAICAADWRDPI